MVWAFATKPFVIGAVAPSSRFVAQEMTRGIGLERAATVLEFGPGTGAFTGLIKRTIRPDARYLAIELNEHMAARFRAMHPDLTLAASRTVGEIEAGGAWSFAKFTIANAALRELAAEAAIGRKRRR
jgi:phospholipid N-methyltransferase